MKKITLVSVVLLFFAGSAWSLTVGLTDVGSVDTFLFATQLGNSGDATELAWVKSLLGEDIVMDAKTNTATGWLQTNEDSRVYAFDFMSEDPEYFLVKTGLTDSGLDHFLFKNDPNLAWAVIDLDIPGIESIKNVGKLSHIDEFNGGAPVPEPATMLLLGSGLLGMAGFRRKFKK